MLSARRDTLRIVSLNAWGGQVWEDLSCWLPTINADALCLQEVIRRLEPGPDWLEYRDPYRRLAQRADLFGDVSACLPHHQSRFAPAARGPLSDEGGQTHQSEHGLGQWIAPDLAIAAHWQGFVHGQFRADGWGPEPVPRTCQLTRLATASGDSLVTGHVHGLRDPSGKGDTPARKAQWLALAKALADFAQADEAVILAGDFNVLPGSALFAIMAELGLHDLVTGRGLTDTRTALYKKPQRHANYMFVSKTVDVSAFSAPATPVVSDHRPLILDVALSQHSAPIRDLP